MDDIFGTHTILSGTLRVGVACPTANAALTRSLRHAGGTRLWLLNREVLARPCCDQYLTHTEQYHILSGMEYRTVFSWVPVGERNDDPKKWIDRELACGRLLAAIHAASVRVNAPSRTPAESESAAGI
jgi:hypothetical protein